MQKSMKLTFATIRNWFNRLKHYGLRNTCVLIRHLKKEGLFSLKHKGCFFYLRGNTVDFAVFNSIFAVGEYDFSLSFKPEVIIDAGAYTGFSSVYFHKRYPEAEIIAVEPEETNFSLLLRNTASFSNIRPIQGGIYGEETRLIITDQTAEKYAFRVEQSKNHEGTVPGYTISSLMKSFNLNSVDLLKLDIEGAEYSVFSHDTDSWLPLVKVVVAELHEFIKPGVRELVIRSLKEKGFKTVNRGENLIAYKDPVRVII